MVASYDVSIHELIRKQVPQRLLEQGLDFALMTDPYHLRTVARFIVRNHLTQVDQALPEIVLERLKIDGRFIACKIPDWYISHLCTIPI
jgi:hypothetical protein